MDIDFYNVFFLFLYWILFFVILGNIHLCWNMYVCISLHA